MLERHRVLLVDDDRCFRRLVSMTLREQFLVIEAESGEQALELLKAFTPECVLLDMEMPGWTGLYTLTQFRSVPKMQNVPIVMLTANSDRDVVVEAIAAGASDYVLKQSLRDGALRDRLKANLKWSRERRVGNPHFRSSSTTAKDR